MAKKGENIYKRKDGRWEARYIKGYTDDKKIHFGYCYAKTYKEVKQKVQSMRNLNQFNNYKDSTKFSTYCEYYMKQKQLSVKKSTYVKYCGFMKRYLLPKFGDKSLHTIRAETVLAFSKELVGEGLSTKSVRDILTFLRAVLSYAQFSVRGQAPNFRLLLPKESKKEPRVLTMSEQCKLEEYLRSNLDRCRAGMLLALYTGLRIGELCALRAEDISLDNGIIYVRRTVQRIQEVDQISKSRTSILFNEPKSESSFRIIPLTNKAEEICRQWVPKSAEAFFLTDSAEKIIEPRALQYRFNKIVQDCCLENVSFHTLRHTFATRCIEVGFELKSLSEVLGHSSPNITLERYVHSSLQLKKENMEKLTAAGM